MIEQKMTRYTTSLFFGIFCMTPLAGAQNVPNAQPPAPDLPTPPAVKAVTAKSIESLPMDELLLALSQLDTVQLVEKLGSPDHFTRDHAFYHVLGRRTEMENALLNNFDRLKKEGKGLNDFGGPFSKTILAMGQWRLQDAIGRLVPMIDFQLNRDQRAGGVTVPSNYYPAVYALVQIGGTGVVNGIYGELGLPETESRLKAMTSVLSGVLGEDLFRLWIQQKLAGRLDKYRKVNLERMLQLLDPKEPLLDYPKQ